jgi:hypothetical protein
MDRAGYNLLVFIVACMYGSIAREQYYSLAKLKHLHKAVSLSKTNKHASSNKLLLTTQGIRVLSIYSCSVVPFVFFSLKTSDD